MLLLEVPQEPPPSPLGGWTVGAAAATWGQDHWSCRHHHLGQDYVGAAAIATWGKTTLEQPPPPPPLGGKRVGVVAATAGHHCWGQEPLSPGEHNFGVETKEEPRTSGGTRECGGFRVWF